MSELQGYLQKRTAEDMSQEDLVREGNRLAEAIEAVRVRRSREDVNAFNEYVFEIEQGDIHYEWHDLIDDPSSNRTLIIAPRNHGKTTQISGRCLWEVGHDHNLRFKYVMGADKKASNIVDNIGKIIEFNERLHRVFPDLKPGNKSSWTKKELFVERDRYYPDATFEASGVLASGVSGRADAVVFDDIVTSRNAILQPSLQKQVKQQYSHVWIPTIEDFGRIIYVATPWTDVDQTAAVMQADGWKRWIRPATVEGEPIWPEKWSIEALEQKRQEIGDRAYAQQYMLKMAGEEERVFSRESIEECLSEDIYLGEGISPDWSKYMGVDLARTRGGGNYTVIFVIAVDDNRRRWVVDITRVRIRAAEIAALIVEKYEEHHPEIVMVENNAFQQIIVDQLTEIDCSIPVQGHYTGAKKHDLSTGVPSLATQIDNGGWVIPYAEDHEGLMHDCPVCAWIDEMVAYPLGEYTDTVMAMWLADIATKGGKFSKSQFDAWYNAPKTERELIAASDALEENNGTTG